MMRVLIALRYWLEAYEMRSPVIDGVSMAVEAQGDNPSQDMATAEENVVGMEEGDNARLSLIPEQLQERLDVLFNDGQDRETRLFPVLGTDFTIDPVLDQHTYDEPQIL